MQCGSRQAAASSGGAQAGCGRCDLAFFIQLYLLREVKGVKDPSLSSLPPTPKQKIDRHKMKAEVTDFHPSTCPPGPSSHFLLSMMMM